MCNNATLLSWPNQFGLKITMFQAIFNTLIKKKIQYLYIYIFFFNAEIQTSNKKVQFKKPIQKRLSNSLHAAIEQKWTQYNFQYY